ncbi:MAG: hypothetical protein E6J41_04305 [Chloroflexi bacterium]|nr:MAG: hypothetical protein E6J41_04305 [Chloroflexota bacterium]
MHALLLKAAATALTIAAAAAAIVHVSGHLKTAAAPLHPAVVGGSAAGAGVGLGSDGRLHLTPSVRSGSVQAVTSTYDS